MVMKKEWLSILVEVRGSLVDLAVAVLAQQGSCGLLVDNQQLDTFEVPDGDLDASRNYQVTAYFQTQQAVEALLCDLESAFAAVPVFQLESLSFSVGPAAPDTDWAQNWKQYFSTFQIGQRLIVHPSWEKPVVAKEQVAIEIDPGMAFGTGTHATTRLCLEAIAEVLSQATGPLRMIDVGTGSGILAIGAAALGCESVVGNDIDPVACDVARDNVARNGLQSRVMITGEPLETIDGSFDLVVANILAEENVRLKDELLQRLVPGGWLVLSGILREKESLVSTAFNSWKLEQRPVRYSEDWVCLVFRRQSP